MALENTGNPYNYFPSFVLRTPLLSLNFILSLYAKKIVSDSQLISEFQKPFIREAIFLASPTLYDQVLKWENNQLHDPKKISKIRFSLLKYLTRISSRCTPFGLFAGCALGTIETSTNIYLNTIESYHRHTRLDMNFLVALSQSLVKLPFIKNQIHFYPNSSLYTIGTRSRYVEYYYEKSKRQHHMSEVDRISYLDKILKKSEAGATLEVLSQLIVDSEVNEEDANNFVEELVENQILISELEPAVSGPEFLDQIIQVLHKIPAANKLTSLLQKITEKLDHLDCKIGNSPEAYIEIAKELEFLDTDFELKFLFQTDLFLNQINSTLDMEIVKEVQKVMQLLNQICFPLKENNLSRFAKVFSDRYGDREIELSKALDVETGIGYPADRYSGDVNPLIDDLFLPVDNSSIEKSVSWTVFDDIIQNKLIECQKEGKDIINLTDKDFVGLVANWDDIPDTLSTIIEVVELETESFVVFPGVWGSSAANLLGRFCHGDSNIEEFTKKITNTEQRLHQNKILAEIVHLPESRVGNILMKPSLRDYEIPYLAKSLVDKEHQLTLDDLTISVVRNRIILRSIKLKKEVIPHLTNAHNFSSNSLPIYHFLCDLQGQGQRGALRLQLSDIFENQKFIPRIAYGKIILKKARWKLLKEDIKSIFEVMDHEDKLMNELNYLRKQLRIPQYVELTDNDNTLLINFDNVSCVHMFMDLIKNRADFILTEFLFHLGSPVNSAKGKYVNQIILSFFNGEKLRHAEKKE